MAEIQREFVFEKPVRKVQPYKTTNADRRIRKQIKISRGLYCVQCRKTFGCEELVVHHILETRIFPEYARSDHNMMVLCRKCHSGVTVSEGLAGAALLAFYAGLEKSVRDFHVPFVAMSRK